jgi:hypothetical protein
MTTATYAATATLMARRSVGGVRPWSMAKRTRVGPASVQTVEAAMRATDTRTSRRTGRARAMDRRRTFLAAARSS